MTAQTRQNPPNESEKTALVFKALGDHTRCQILQLLAGQELTIGEVVAHFDMTRAGIKKHLTLLEDGGFVSVRKQGRERYNRLSPEGFKTAGQWLGFFDTYWTEKLSALQDAAEQENNND